MKNLGRILFFLIPVFLYAKVYMDVDKEKIYYGESVAVTISAEGKSIKFPQIDSIEGYKIISKAKSESVNIIGNSVKRVVKLSFTFIPDKNVTVGPFEILVDGKKEKTKAIKIEVIRKAKKYEDIYFEIKSDKKEAYVGEPIIVTLILKLKKSLEIIDYRFYPPKFENFWVKRLDDSITKKYLVDTPNYLVKELKYIIFPQKSGNLKIDPAVIKIATPENKNDLYGVLVTIPKWRTVISNSINIDVKPLPENVDLIGEFKIKTYVDKKKVKPNEPVNFTVEIDGVGNIENFEEIKLDIKDAVVYSGKPKKIEDFKNKKLNVKFVQKFSIISDKDFVIPPIEIKYFDLKDRKIKLLKTEPVNIVVNGGEAVKKESKEVLSDKNKKDIIYKKDGYLYLSVGFLSGVIFSIILYFLFRLIKKREIRFNFKSSEKELLSFLLPYIYENETAYNYAKELYEKIYEGKNIKLDKKKLEEFLKKLKSG